eukprot:CAMPEP_0181385282 /NCGR_PEP_ID=MMETSP1106-20121128/22470_1 /TAXON_ID=81844 /ORGANISM="Mantoniella antarctica, Strain SL-175" /LENGTH=355 /DNA_ID=CAMNT_0023505319 /DNA_START=201 /DNA_END=1265 /DNA_ORIENTATION=-
MLGKLLVALGVVAASTVTLLVLAARAGLLSLTCTATVLSIVVLVSLWRTLEPTEHLLLEDLKKLAKITDTDNFANKEYTVEDVERYYTGTTFRDYKLLELATGCNAMHTNLVPSQKLPFLANHLKQLLYVMMNMRNCSLPSNVLEVGFGKGSNSVFLRSLKPSGANFFALDVVPAHVKYAKAYAAGLGYDDIEFHLGDASDPPSEITANTYDLIFGVESFCHLDNDKMVEGFLSFASKQLAPGGKIVIVDGFRADNFDQLSTETRRAMELSESGFRIRRMPSKALWKKLSARKGFVSLDDIDLTLESLCFWKLGWKLGHIVLFLPSLVGRYLRKGGERAETFANLVSVCMTAYAM